MTLLKMIKTFISVRRANDYQLYFQYLDDMDYGNILRTPDSGECLQFQENVLAIVCHLSILLVVRERG